MIHLISVIYVAKDFVKIITYIHTLEYIQVIHLIVVIYVVKYSVRILIYRITLEYILVQCSFQNLT